MQHYLVFKGPLHGHTVYAGDPQEAVRLADTGVEFEITGVMCIPAVGEVERADGTKDTLQHIISRRENHDKA